MKKRGVKKQRKNILVLFGICTLLLAGILITAQDVGKIREKIADALSNRADAHIEKFADKKGIDIESITNVTEVDFGNLPSEIDVGNAVDANVGIYEIEFDENGEEKKVFVVSYSRGELDVNGTFQNGNVTLPPEATRRTQPVIPAKVPKSLLFGFTGEMDRTGFLESDAEIEGAINNGYVMVGNGNVVNLSANIEVYEGEGIVQTTLYKNGNPTLLTHSIAVGEGKIITELFGQSYFVYNIFVAGNISFKKDDTLAIYVTLSEGTVLRRITASCATG